MKWFRNLPKKNGDYLWVSCWTGGCCVRKLGVATVYDGADVKDIGFGCDIAYEVNGKRKRLSFEGNKPDEHEGKYYITAFTRYGAPPKEFSEEEIKLG